jgi:1-deoxy-D-xylulose-5-phosphate synthase
VAETLPGQRAAVELGKAEIVSWGRDGAILCCGALLSECLRAARRLQDHGLDVGVVNARFVKPLDADVIQRALRECSFVVTVEEGCLSGGYGSAVLETASDAGWDVRRLRRLGLPDRFIEHGARRELLTDLGLDAEGIAQACLALAGGADMLGVRAGRVRETANQPACIPP